MKGAWPHSLALQTQKGHRASLLGLISLSGLRPLLHPAPSALHKAAQLTCQRLRARRNFSCLVLMKWASSAGTDFWGSPGERATLGVGRAPGASCSPGRPPLLLASLSPTVSQASPRSAYSPGTRGGRGTWQHWAEPWGRKGRSRSGRGQLVTEASPGPQMCVLTPRPSAEQP